MFRALQASLPPNELAAVTAWLQCFFPFQLDIVLDGSMQSILNKSRKIGGSLSMAAAAILWGLFGDETMFVSEGLRESIVVLKLAKKHLEVLCDLGSEWASPTASSATSVTLASGGGLVALPATSGGRSFDGHIVLDEFAYHGEFAKQVWDAAVGATTLKDHRIRVCSTPNGTGNKFHELWTTATDYRRLEVPIELAIKQGYPIDPVKLLSKCNGDQRLFDQLYRCKFLDNEQQYIPTTLIDDSIVDALEAWEGFTYAGLDVGRKNDLTCLVVVRVDESGNHWVVAVETKKRTEESDLDALVSTAFRHWRCERLCMDETGIGTFPAAKYRREYGRRVEPVSFTLQSKESLATTLYQRFADRTIKIHRGDTELRDDVASVRRTVTDAGNVRYDAPATERGHADRAWALALALHACSKPINVRNEEYA